MAEIITSGQVVPNITDGLHLMNGIKGLRSLPRHSVDMLLTDPPYGTTKNYWDTPLPLPELWEAIRWAVKPNGAVLLFAQCPFDKALGASNLAMLRYEWVWVKAKATGFLNANRAPLKKTENILVFYQKPPVYNPQFTYAEPYKRVYPKSGSSPNYGKFERTATASNDGRRYPTNVLYAPAVTGDIQADVMGNLHRLGVQSLPLDGRDRLALLHGQMHPGSHEPFRFSWKDIPKTGLGTKDYIAPDSFDFRDSRTFRVGRYFGAVSYLQILASELSDKLLAEILELDAELTVTMHIQTVDQLKAIKTIKGKISDIGRMKAEEQKKAVRAGYDMEILPPDLITFSKDAAELLADLQSRNERMFLLTFTVVNLAPNRQRLENDVFTVGGIAQKYNCALKRLDWQQEQGFVSALALGYNGIEIQRGMTTSSTAIFIPFMTRELRMGGQALYYGMNALSHNVIMADRKKLKSANGMYLGSTGSGKSFAAKRELLNVFLATNDRIVIVDPMGEYVPLARRLGAQVIEIAPDSPHHLNPMDIQLNMNGGESPLSMKADFLLSLCELILGGKEGLQPIERTVIDRCVRLVYREMALGLETAQTPLLQDLYEELLKQPEPEAKRVATALELYCTGSLNLFNHHTNVKTRSRVVCIVLKGMGENLRKIAMHITNEFVTQAVDDNHRAGVATWCYFDEFHVLLRDPLTASYFVAVWKMLRKKGCVPSALTQNVKDLLASREIENILDNTDFMVLLSQAQSDRAILAKQLGISEHQLSYITHSNSGEGLLFYGNVTIPFVDRFPRGEIYDLLTTRPEDMAHERKDE